MIPASMAFLVSRALALRSAAVQPLYDFMLYLFPSMLIGLSFIMTNLLQTNLKNVTKPV